MTFPSACFITKNKFHFITNMIMEFYFNGIKWYVRSKNFFPRIVIYVQHLLCSVVIKFLYPVNNQYDCIYRDCIVTRRLIHNHSDYKQIRISF